MSEPPVGRSGPGAAGEHIRRAGSAGQAASLQRRHQRWAAAGGGCWHCWRPLRCCGCRGRASPEVSAERGCGALGVRGWAAQCKAGQCRRGWSAAARRVPGQPFAPAGLREPRQCARAVCPSPPGAALRGPRWAAEGARGGRRAGSGSGDHALHDGLPHLLYPRSLPHLHVLQPPSPTFLESFLLPRRRGPLRPAASGAAHSLCGSRETLWSGRSPGEGATPPLPAPGAGGGLRRPGEPLLQPLSRRERGSEPGTGRSPGGPSLGKGEEPAAPRDAPRCR